MSLFITLEGIEGCGKSTQAKLLASRFRRDGRDCLLTREPGGTPIGRQIRSVILSPANRRMSAETELGLYFSDRAQHLREVVWPALDAGRIVVCDRFTDSTIAYQGYGRGLSLRSIRSLDRVMTGAFRPHLTILLDLPAEAGLTRARARNRGSVAHRREGRFEREQLEFHERVRGGYARLARREPDRYIVVGAQGERRDVHEAIWSSLVASPKIPAEKRRTRRA